MPDQREELRSVAWGEVFPWLMIFRCFRLSISAPVLLVGTLAAALTPLGWQLAGTILSDEEVQAWEVVGPSHTVEASFGSSHSDWSLDDRWQLAVQRVQTTYWRLVTPLRWLLRTDLGWRPFFYLVFGLIWTTALWALFAGVITRIGVVQLGRRERVGMLNAARFAVFRWPSYFLAPLFPLLGFVVAIFLAGPLGWLMRLDFGLLVAGLIWPLVLIGGLVLAVLAVGLVFGWPLMWVTVSAERNGDVFEATQRCYSYTFSRPLHYLFYVVVAVLFGALCWLLVDFVANLIIALPRWAVAWGTGHERLTKIVGESGQGMFRAGQGLIGFWENVVRTVAGGFLFSFFWTVYCAIFLLLRRNVDPFDFDEVYVEDEQPQYGLPDLVEDAAGVPGVSPKSADTVSDRQPDSPSASSPTTSEPRAGDGESPTERPEQDLAD